MRKRVHTFPALVVVALAGIFGQSYLGRREVVHSQRVGCERGIEERLDTIAESDSRITGNLAIARDPRQPATTRSARAAEARDEERIRERRYARVDPAHGGRLVCSDAYPSASPFPRL
jgi:hypothetical protein